jgi:hypothetical protein
MEERALKQAMLRYEKELLVEPLSENENVFGNQADATVARLTEQIFSVPSIRLLKGKGSKEVADSCSEILAESRCFFPLIRVHSDSGGEWAGLESICKAQGWFHTHVSSQPASNGRSERLIGSASSESKQGDFC